MKTTHVPKRGFTLTELVVVSGIASMAFALAAPLMDKGREEADRRRCQFNLQQLGLAMNKYAYFNGGFPPMARSWTPAHYTANQPGPGGWYNGHGWYSYVAPHIGYDDWASNLDFTVSLAHTNNSRFRRGGLRIKVYACPADIGLTRNEWPSNTWARVHGNYVVNAGNTNYGQTNLFITDRFLGAPFTGEVVTPAPAISDGLANTLMMSEVIVLPETYNYWGGVYSEIQESTGGQVFTGRNPPNSRFSDTIAYGRGREEDFRRQGIPYPEAGSGGAKGTYIAPRSKHPGGINASLCDGSVRFFDDTIDPVVWRALSTARGAESGLATEVKLSGKGK